MLMHLAYRLGPIKKSMNGPSEVQIRSSLLTKRIMLGDVKIIQLKYVISKA
jgi:hypothetical protein